MAYNVEVTYEEYSDALLIPDGIKYEGKTLEELPGLKKKSVLLHYERKC